MIRIMQIITDSNIGGAGRCLISYLKYCDRSRFEPVVVLPTGSELIPEMKGLARLIEADKIAEKSFSLDAIRELKRIIRDEKPVLVHTHGSLSGRIAARQCGAGVIYTRHSAFPVPGYLKSGPGHWANGAINTHYADAIIAVSPACSSNLIDSGIPERIIHTMMNGVEPLRRADQLRCSELRKELGVPEGCFTAGIFARLEPYKGHAILLAAVEKLVKENRDFRILIGGKGPAEEHILEEIHSRKLEQHVIFLGFVRNMEEVLSILDVQLNCSYGTEASSIALIEGMSLGLATVASNYGGNPWQIVDGYDGLLFENCNSDDLADQLRRLMDSCELVEQLREHALESYHRKYTGVIFAENVEKVYDKVLEQRRSI